MALNPSAALNSEWLLSARLWYVCLTRLDEATFSTVTEYAGRHIENTIDSDLQIASV